MNETQEGRIFPAPQNTLIDIHHPTFRQGYQTGRKAYFQDPETMTDKQVVELLDCLFADTATEEAQAKQEHLYFYTGQLFGRISGQFIPRQLQEEDLPQMQQERFLAKIARDYGEQGPRLAESIQHLWKVHDQIATTLDADDFDQILHRGAEKISIL